MRCAFSVIYDASAQLSYRTIDSSPACRKSANLFPRDIDSIANRSRSNCLDRVD
jgi:hypothetical protein